MWSHPKQKRPRPITKGEVVSVLHNGEFKTAHVQKVHDDYLQLFVYTMDEESFGVLVWKARGFVQRL